MEMVTKAYIGNKPYLKILLNGTDSAEKVLEQAKKYSDCYLPVVALVLDSSQGTITNRMYVLSELEHLFGNSKIIVFHSTPKGAAFAIWVANKMMILPRLLVAGKTNLQKIYTTDQMETVISRELKNVS